MTSGERAMRFVPSATGRPRTLAEWRAAGSDASNAGVSVPNDTDIESLQAQLPRLALIALEFPKWTDGRAYSQARLLRARYRYTGAIRAVGDVVADMLPLLARTGFSEAQLRADQDVAVARRALAHFPAHYQGDVRQPAPVFARQGSKG